ncbi:MAG: B12-binding domain-containing radical SAM protein [Deltaproteobacteria bacterium]|nr:B12-binding domain-containing radical SAM protein [Deltaproteobacteria bacterium]
MPELKIALVEAISKSTHVYSRTYLPRAGVATLGAVLKSHGYHVEIFIDLLSPEEEARLLTYDVIGIGSLSSTIKDAYHLADYLKRNGKTVVMGGPHVTFMPEEAIGHCDFAVLGEGEGVLPRLLSAIEKKISPEDVKGIVYMNPDGTTHYTGPSEFVDYKSLPSPDFLLSSKVAPENIPPIITTSRGCPHDCSFCSVTSVFGRKYRFKDKEQVIAELRAVKNRSVCFGDDNFCANSVRTKKLLRAMIKSDAVPLRWSGQMCVEAASDNELLNLMGETRCRIVYVGIESVEPETLKKYGKAHKVDAIKTCVENLHDHNIGIHGMFVVDSCDQPDAAKHIVDYAIETDIDTIQIFSVTPFPGTRSFTENKDRIIHQQWSKYDGMHVIVKPEKCSAYDMQMAIVDQMNRFYSIGRAITAYKKHRAWRMKYRLGGHILMRRWVRENQAYIEKLQSGFEEEGMEIKGAQAATYAPLGASTR